VPELLTVEQALAHVLAHAETLPTETVALDDAFGRVLREPARSAVDLPPFPSSAMDGFALRAVDTPGDLPIAFRIAAGAAPPGPVPAGAAAGIATGGTVPEGADAIVPIEVVEDHGDRLIVPGEVIRGQHIRPRGGDVGAGEIVVDPGAGLGAVQIGALAAAGVPTLVCSVRPRVAILATGDELRSPGDALEPGQIYESNRRMIAAALVGSGAVTDVLPVSPDDEVAQRLQLVCAGQSNHIGQIRAARPLHTAIVQCGFYGGREIGHAGTVRLACLARTLLKAACR